jgi:putative FmdB family regulatory protein
MPIYEFKCNQCGYEWSQLRKMGEDDPGECFDCHSSDTRKLLSKGNFHLRGRGWAIDGYNKPGESE